MATDRDTFDLYMEGIEVIHSMGTASSTPWCRPSHRSCDLSARTESAEPTMSKGLKGVPLRREQELLQKGSSSGKSLGGSGVFLGEARFAGVAGLPQELIFVNHG